MCSTHAERCSRRFRRQYQSSPERVRGYPLEAILRGSVFAPSILGLGIHQRTSWLRNRTALAQFPT